MSQNAGGPFRCPRCGRMAAPTALNCGRCGKLLRTRFTPHQATGTATRHARIGNVINSTRQRLWFQTVAGTVCSTPQSSVHSPTQAWISIAATAILLISLVVGGSLTAPLSQTVAMVATVAFQALSPVLVLILMVMGIALMFHRRGPWPSLPLGWVVTLIARLVVMIVRGLTKIFRVLAAPRPSLSFVIRDDDGTRWQIRLMNDSPGVFMSDKVVVRGRLILGGVVVATSVTNKHTNVVLRPRTRPLTVLSVVLVIAAAASMIDFLH